MAKLQGKLFFGPRIWQFIKDTDFIKVLTARESEGWKSLELIVEIGNHKAPN